MLILAVRNSGIANLMPMKTRTHGDGCPKDVAKKTGRKENDLEVGLDCLLLRYRTFLELQHSSYGCVFSCVFADEAVR